MRLVIEREGGFDIVESSEAVTRIEVASDAVEVWYMDSDGEESVKRVQMSSHTEACRVSAAIAQKCGTLVEALAKGAEADGEAAMGAASAALVRERSKPWKPASEWVEGEPPRDGRWYVARTGAGFNVIVRWHDERWRDAMGDMLVFWAAHLPTPIPER